MRKQGENGLLSVMKLTYEHLQGCVGGKIRWTERDQICLHKK